MSGASFPATLNPGQAVTLSVQFDPTNAGAVTGQLTITSNSSIRPSAAISLSGTGETASHQVDLSWQAPSASSDPIAGYNVYRSSDGGSSYQRVNSSEVTQTTYVDTTVQGGQSYDFVVRSVDSSGVESAPSNMTSLTIP
jgi:fibronectin type 3 domain-containing protein